MPLIKGAVHVDAGPVVVVELHAAAMAVGFGEMDVAAIEGEENPLERRVHRRAAAGEAGRVFRELQFRQPGKLFITGGSRLGECRAAQDDAGQKVDVVTEAIRAGGKEHHAAASAASPSSRGRGG